MTYEELLFKVKDAKSAEEIFTIANANGMEITEEQAKTYFEQINKKGNLTMMSLTLFRAVDVTVAVLPFHMIRFRRMQHTFIS